MLSVGIFSRTYEAADLKLTYNRMKKHGICHTQFNLSNAGLPSLPDFVEDEKLEEIKRLTGENGIFLDALSGTFNMIDPDEEARKRGISQFALQCRVASVLEIPVVSLCTGSKNPVSKWKWHEDNLKQSSWDDLLRSTEQILKYAEENHVILGVETEASNIVCTPERARKYLDIFDSPHLKIIMDGANLFRPSQVEDMDQVLEEAFDILGKDIVLAHAKDLSFDGNVAFVAAGKGILNFKYYVELLKESGYDGALVMHGLSEAQVPESKKFLEEIICHG